MKKTILKLAFFLALIGVSTFLVSMIYRKMENKKVVAKNTKKLPATQVKGLDSKSFTIENSNNFFKVLVFFNTECEHCQNEAANIKKHIADFEKTQMTFISVEPLENVKKFATKYQLTAYSNIKFAHMEAIESSKQFGISSFPTIFIYNKEGELLKQYKGETKIEAILKLINQ